MASVIVGARDAAQFRDNAAGVGWSLPPDAKARLDAISAPPPRYPKDSEVNVRDRHGGMVAFSVRRIEGSTSA